MATTTVRDYETARVLEGEASEDLVRASMAAGPTGAVAAHRDADGVWRHVPESMVRLHDMRGERVVVVYVETRRTTMTTTAAMWAEVIVEQMSDEDLAAIRETGTARALAAEIDAMAWSEDDGGVGPRPRTADVVREIERIASGAAQWSDDDVCELRAEAATAGDLTTVAWCDRWLAGDPDAIAETRDVFRACRTAAD